MGIVYLITNNVNGKLYIGQTTLPLAARWKLHVSAARRRVRGSPYLEAAIRKHGVRAFSFRELTQANSQEELNVLERRYIEECGTRSTGYNLAAGGQNINHAKQSDSARLRANPTRGRKWIYKDGQKARVLQSEVEAYLEFGWCLGQGNRRSISIEARQKISRAFKGKQLTDEHRKNIATGLLGRQCSENTRKRISEKWTPERKNALRLCTIKRNKAQIGTRWITRGGINKRVSSEEATTHVGQGWQFGRVL